MSNSLLNKLKVIDSSRNRLKTILQEKNVATSGNSLPALIEDVNGLYKPNEMPTEWNGVPAEQEPNYYKPGIDFDTIYANDSDKDNYTSVGMLLFKVENGVLDTFGQNYFHNMTKYKFSDDGVLRNPARNTESPSHTWNSANDIEGTDGHYRWVMVYSNATTSVDYNATYVAAEALIVFKGTYNGLGWRDYNSAPAYTEIKSGVTISGGISKSDEGSICPQPRTFICNADLVGFNDYLFQNCINLQFFKCTSKIYGTGEMNYLFDNCINLKYCYFTEVYRFNECAFRYCRDCYLYIGTVKGGIFGRTDSRSDRYQPFAETESVRIRIDLIQGYLSYLASDRDGINYAKGLEIEIGTITSYILSNVFNQYFVNAKGIMVHNIGGDVGASAFVDAPLYGTVRLYNGNNTAGNIGDSAFAGTKITKLICDNANIAAINNYAFRDSALQSLEINAGCTVWGDYIFRECRNLKTVIMGDTVTTFTPNTFRESYVENVTTGAALTIIPNNAFRYHTGLKSIILHANTTTLGTYCFAFTKLTSINLPENITEISDHCFFESEITTVTSESPITIVRACAFEKCYNLTSMDVSHLTTVGDIAFYGTNITHFEIPSTLTNYHQNAFVYMHRHIYFNSGFVPSGDLSLAGTNINNDNVLETLYTIPNGRGYTLYMYPTMFNGATQANTHYYDIIKNKKITDTGEGLVWDNNGSQTVAQYVASKNWTIQ